MELNNVTRINKEMLDKFNQELERAEVSFRFEFMDEKEGMIQVVPSSMKWLNSSILNLSEEFRRWAEGWFMHEYNIKLSYNNTGDIIWSSYC